MALPVTYLRCPHCSGELVDAGGAVLLEPGAAPRAIALLDDLTPEQLTAPVREPSRIATTRVPIGSGSATRRVDQLALDEGELTRDHAGAVGEADQLEPLARVLARGAQRMIARAAEGSARDGLSILDQAIAHGAGAVTAEQVRAMLGLSDRGAVRHLLGLLRTGDRDVLAALHLSYDSLADELRRQFRLLSLHPGGDFDACALASITGTSADEAESWLDALVDDNLLRQDASGRYHFHDLVRDCARALSDTFAGIAPADAPGFIAAQLVGAGLALLAAKILSPA